MLPAVAISNAHKKAPPKWGQMPQVPPSGHVYRLMISFPDTIRYSISPVFSFTVQSAD